MKCPRVRTPATLLFVLALSTACTEWRVITQPSPAEYVRSAKPGAIRVTRIDSTKVVLQAPEVIGDSVVGGGEQPTRSAVLVTDIKTLEARAGNPGGSLAIFGGIMLFVAALVAVSSALSGDWF